MNLKLSDNSFYLNSYIENEIKSEIDKIKFLDKRLSIYKHHMLRIDLLIDHIFSCSDHYLWPWYFADIVAIRQSCGYTLRGKDLIYATRLEF